MSPPVLTSARPWSPAGSARAAVRRGADPRSRFLLMIVINVVVMGRSSGVPLWAAAVVVGLALACDVHLRAAASYAALLAVSALVAALPMWWSAGPAAALGVIGFWTLRFAIVLSAGAWFVTTSRVTEIVTAMHASRMPRVLIIPLSVIFRFLPSALEEIRGVTEAMALRGYTGSYWWRHPLNAIEKLAVPVLAASARTADELAAAALIRGLGGASRPTSVVRLRWGAADCVIVTACTALTGLLVAQAVGAWG